MLKKYKSNSCVSLSVTLPTGGKTHISFNPVSGGGSVYYTENEKIQSGLERHPMFGRLFRLAEVVEPAKKADAVVLPPPAKEAEPLPSVETEERQEKAAETIKVGSKTEAIEWLKDHFPEKGYNGFTLKGKEAFEKAQKECNVVFEF